MKKSQSVNKSSNKSSNNSTTLKEKQAMKKSVNKSSNKSSNNSTKSPSIEELRALLAALEEDKRARAAKRAQASEGEESERAQASEGKAPRTYEFSALGAEFDKSRVGAVPTSERAKEYYTEQAALCMRILAACHAPITAEIQVGKMKIKDIISLCDTWEISPMAIRVVLQLAYPIVTVCCGDTERLARDVYNIARANSLMGSRHNTSMYSKAKDKSCALPFKRVAHNLTALGLDFAPVDNDNVESCDFCDNKKDFRELVTLCDYWLDTCKRKRASKKASKKASEASERKRASKASEGAIDNDTLAKLRALLGM